MQNDVATAPAAQKKSFVTHTLPTLLSAAAVLLMIVALILTLTAPIYHVSLGKWAPQTEEDIADLLEFCPELADYADNGFSVSYSFLDYAQDSDKEAKLKKELEGADQPFNYAPENCHGYSAAVSVHAMLEYFEGNEEELGLEGYTPSFMLFYDRDTEFLNDSGSTSGLLTFLFSFPMGILSLIAVIVLLRGLAKKINRTTVRKNGIFLLTVLNAVVHALLLLFLAVTGAVGGAVVLPILFAVLAIACPVVAAVLYKHFAPAPAAAETQPAA